MKSSPTDFIVLAATLLSIDLCEGRISSGSTSSGPSLNEHLNADYYRGPSVVQTARRAQSNETSCLTSFSAQVQGSCGASTLTAAVSTELSNQAPNCGHGLTEELALLFPEGTEVTAEAACADAINAASLPFTALTGEGRLFNKEYFDGGTYLNQEVESVDDLSCPKNVLADGPGRRIEAVAGGALKSRPVLFPEGSNFASCPLRAAVCCFVSDRTPPQDSSSAGGGVQARADTNTDVCYHDLRASPGSNRVQMGYALFEGPEEEDGANCHGFAWAGDGSSNVGDAFKGNALYHVSMVQHLLGQGHVRNVPGAPMCACVDQMPVIERADCTEAVSGTERVTYTYSHSDLRAEAEWSDVQFQPCANGADLAQHYETLATESEVRKFRKHVVGENQCEAATKYYLYSHGIQRKAVAA